MRASQIPLASKCRKSPSVNTGFGSEFSNMGNAFHELARCKVLMQDVDYESLKMRYGLTSKDIDNLKDAIFKVDLNIPADAILFADDHNLQYVDPVSGDKITGTPDFAMIEPKKQLCTLVDWKSGWGDVEDPETNYQTLTYLILIMKNFLEVELNHFYVLIVLPRLGSVKTAYFTRENLEARLKDMFRIIAESRSDNAQYTTGAHCQNCYGCMNCPAFAGEVKKFCTLLEGPGTLIDSKGALQALIPFGKAMVTVANKIDKVAKAFVDQNGPLELGGGVTYAKYIEERDEIIPDKALPVLNTFFGETAHECLSISKTAVEEKSKAEGRGVWGKVYSQLKDKEAIVKKPIVVYRIKKGANNGDIKQISNDGA